MQPTNAGSSNTAAFPQQALSTTTSGWLAPAEGVGAEAASIGLEAVKTVSQGAIPAADELEKSEKVEGRELSDDLEGEGNEKRSAVLEMERDKMVEGLSEEQKKRLEEQG